MPILTKPPEWHNPGSEPPENKKVTGWEIDERPPAGWFNWLFHRIYQSLLELSAAIAGHRDNKDNPHSVTPSQIGAETPAGAQAKVDTHEAKAAPHSGHATTTALNNHVNDKNNPHGVTVEQIGAAPSDAAIPIGGIIMWSGSIDSIPPGWALCDGRNGTPDLRDRFIVGAGGAYNVGNTGGSNTVTLNINQIPSHNHGAGTLVTNTTGSHNHRFAGPTGHRMVGDGEAIPVNMGIEVRDTSSDGDHNHTISGNTASAGGGQPHENRPPYYALAYIMKL